MVIFKSTHDKFEGDLKIKLWGKRLYPTESVNYLGVKINGNLCWQYHVNDHSIKLNGANAFLFKDPSILLFLTPTYSTAVLYGLRIVALFNEL